MAIIQDLEKIVGYCERMGWTSVEYAEKQSSVKHRPVVEQLMKDAQLRKFDVVVVWKLDRFARSMKQFTTNVLALRSGRSSVDRSKPGDRDRQTESDGQVHDAYHGRLRGGNLLRISRI